MVVIKDTMESMQATLEDAKKYAKLAVQCKSSHPELAQIYYNSSKNHIDTYNSLHNQVVKLIDSYKKDIGEPPSAMQAVYDWEHEQAIDEMDDIKRILEQYK